MPLRSLPALGCLLLSLVAFGAPAAAQTTLRPAGDPVLLVGGDGDAFAHPTWSPDGSRLALTRPGYAGLWVTPADGQSLRQLTDEQGAGFGFAWSPDGAALLARVARFDGPQRLDAVKVFDAATGTSFDVSDYRRRMTALPRWSADGASILLASEDGVETFARPTPAEPPARAVPADGAVFLPRGTALTAARVGDAGLSAERLLDERRVLNAVASPDHARVAFEVMGGDLHVMNADGSDLVALGVGNRPTWSPDGQWIAFMRTEDDGEVFTASELVAARTDGSAEVVLTRTPGRLEMNPSWSPDGRWIAFDDLTDGAVYLLPIAR